MPETGGGSGGVPLEQVIEALVDEVVADYRTERASARELVEKSLAGDRRLAGAAAQAASFERLVRTRAYKEARKRAKKDVYYSLRRYKSAGSDLGVLVERLAACPAGGEEGRSLASALIEGHVSTRERHPHAEELHPWLIERLADARAVADVGCGVYPLMFPFRELSRLERYVAAERDATAVAALEAWAAAAPEPRLRPIRWSLEEGWAPLLAAGGVDRFDAALLLKLVAVVERQEPQRLDLLAQVPAARIVVSGSRRSLTKRQSIERRERASLERFRERAGRRLVGELTTGDEVLLVLE